MKVLLLNLVALVLSFGAFSNEKIEKDLTALSESVEKLHSSVEYAYGFLSLTERQLTVQFSWDLERLTDSVEELNFAYKNKASNSELKNKFFFVRLNFERMQENVRPAKFKKLIFSELLSLNAHLLRVDWHF